MDVSRNESIIIKAASQVLREAIRTFIEKFWLSLALKL